MKKSEMYKVAQIVVIKSEDISAEDKLEIIDVLMKDERLALWSEEQEQAK